MDEQGWQQTTVPVSAIHADVEAIRALTGWVAVRNDVRFGSMVGENWPMQEVRSQIRTSYQWIGLVLLHRMSFLRLASECYFQTHVRALQFRDRLFVKRFYIKSEVIAYGTEANIQAILENVQKEGMGKGESKGQSRKKIRKEKKWNQ